MKKTLILIISISTLLTACGGDAPNNNSSQDNVSSSPSVSEVNSSKLSQFMLEDTVCNALTVDDIKGAFNVISEVTVEGTTSPYADGVSCDYNWTRADAEERKQKFMNYVMDQMQGKVDKVPMRLRTINSNISIQIETYKGNIDRFVPPKISEEQLQRQIESAKKRANERLTDEQKKVAGGMASSMMEKMLRQNNQNVTVEGIGDAAYWSMVAGGGLNVLSGNTKMFISLMIGDTKEEDIENAKKIAQLILEK